MKIGILASGSGTNAQAIFDRIREGSLKADVAVLASDNPRAKALERAARENIPTEVVERGKFASREAFDDALCDVLLKAGCELVVLAGYMLIVGDRFFNEFPDRIINLHPALLPSFPGLHGIRDAVRYGVKLTGASAHFVEREVDAGPLIIQAALPVRENEAEEQLAERIHRIEHRILPQAIQWFAEGRLAIAGRKVSLAPAPRRQLQVPGYLVWPQLEEGF